jgi:hypothetical protein
MIEIRDPDAEHRSRSERRASRRKRRRRRRRLPVTTRVWLWLVGAVIFALGIAGLFLPFLQGILFLLLAAAILSLASETVYHWLEGVAADRWPELWQRIERLHTRLHWRFRSRPRKRADDEEADRDSGAPDDG